MNPTSTMETGEQPSPVVTAGEQPQSSDHMAQLGEHSSEALLAALEEQESGADSNETPPALGEAPPVTREPVGEKPPGTEAAAGAEAGEPKEGAVKTPDRVRINSLPPADQKLMLDAVEKVRKGEAANITEALALAGVTIGKKAAEASDETAEGEAGDQPESPQSTVLPPALEQVTELKTKIADLREQRRQAIRDYDSEAQGELTDQIEDAQADLLRAEQAAVAQQASSRDYNVQYAEAVDAVEATYPAAKDETSAFYRILSDRIAVAEARGDAALQDPNFIRSYADQVAADLGMSQGAQTSPPPLRPRQVVGANLAPAHSSADRPTQDQIRMMIQTVDPEALEAAVCTE